MRSWLAIGVIALVGAAVVSLLLRLPPETALTDEGSAPVETLRVALDLRADAVFASRVAVDVHRAVRLEATNHALVPVRLQLSGYEDRVDSGTLAPGDTWRGTFVADRPGEDFAWLVDGRPAGRFVIAGSHLTEGHR